MAWTQGAAIAPGIFALGLWLMGASLAWVGTGRFGPGQVLAAYPLAFGVTTAVSLAQVLVRFPFGLLSVLMAWAFLLLLALGLRRTGISERWLPRDGDGDWSGARATVITAALLLASVALAHFVLWRAGGGTWETVSQTWDAFFDTNAIRHGYESGDLAPSRIADFAYPEPIHTWYPTPFHSIGALSMHVGARDAVVASNWAASLVAGALWPSTVALGVRAIFGRGKTVTLCALTLWWGFWGMPWGPLGWGVLWATALATAFVPLVLAGFAGVLGLGAAEGKSPDRRRKLGLLLVGAAALGLAHPRLALVVAALLVGLWTWYAGTLVVARRAGPARARMVATSGLVAPLLGLVAVVLFVGRDNIWARTWGPSPPLWEELLRYAVGAPVDSMPQVVAALLMMTGLVTALRRRSWRWIAVLAIGAVLLDVMTAVTQGIKVTNALTRFWYSDRFRTVVLTSFPLLLLAIAGVLQVVRVMGIKGWYRARVFAVWALFAVVVVSGAWGAEVTLKRSYVGAALDPRASVVSPAEREFFKEVARTVKPGERVLNNANDGSAFLYAYQNRQPVFYLAGATRGSTVNGFALRTLLNTEVDVLVCRRLIHDHIVWVLNGGPTYHTDIIKEEPAPGMQVTPNLKFLTEVGSGGGFTLYKVTGCPIS